MPKLPSCHVLSGMEPREVGSYPSPCPHRLWTRGDFFALTHVLQRPAADGRESAAAAGRDNLSGLSLRAHRSRRDWTASAGAFRGKPVPCSRNRRGTHLCYVPDSRGIGKTPSRQCPLDSLRLLPVQLSVLPFHRGSAVPSVPRHCPELDWGYPDGGLPENLCHVPALCRAVQRHERLFHRRRAHWHPICRGGYRAGAFHGGYHRAAALLVRL